MIIFTLFVKNCAKQSTRLHNFTYICNKNTMTDKQLEILLIQQKKKSFDKGLWTGLLIGVIVGLLMAALSACTPCYTCTIHTEWPESHQQYDTTITVCNPVGGIENFERNNTYIDTSLSDYDTYQTCNCELINDK